MVNVHSSYNTILGRPVLTALKAITSILHLKIKFPTDFGVGKVRGDQKISRQCYVHTMFSSDDKVKDVTLESQKGKESLNIEVETCKEGITQTIVELAEKIKEIELIVGNREQTVRIGIGLASIL